MRAPGGLIDDPPWAFAFRILEPAPDVPRRLLVLLHGVDGDETQLARLGAQTDAHTLVALPRGPRSIAGDRCGWFREGFGDDGPQVVAEEAEESRLKLIDFLGQLQGRHAVEPSATTIAGFSQGAMLCASAALTAPTLIAGFCLLSGRVLPEIEPLLAARAQLAHLRALLVHGTRDTTLPPAWLDRTEALLQQLGVTHETRLRDAGHELTPAMEADVLGWLAAR